MLHPQRILLPQQDLNLLAAQITNQIQDLLVTQQGNNPGLDKPRARGRPRVVRQALPLRVPASTDFFEAALKVPRQGSGFSVESWARARLSITLLRFFGLRASEAALVRLSDLKAIIEGRVTQMDIMQPKTGTFRKVVVPNGLAKLLKDKCNTDLFTLLKAAGDLGDCCLGSSVKGRTRGRLKNKRDWVTALNRYLKFICDKLGESPRITTHCFRVNFITSLLNQPNVFSLIEVSKLMGHSGSSTTERYYRYYPQEDLPSKIQIALTSEQNKANSL